MNDCFMNPNGPMAVDFTVGDRRACLPTVALIVKLAETARKEGVLALEDMAKTETDSFFIKKGIAMVCDGQDPAIVREVLSNFIWFSPYKGSELLIRMISMEGILAIQRGENPYILRDLLLSMLGEPFYEEACIQLGINNNKTEDSIVERYFNDMETETYPAGTNLLEDVFALMGNRDIQMILRGTELDVFVPAFRGSSKKVQHRLCENLSRTIAAHTIHACATEPMPEIDAIIKAQHAMLSQYHALLAGE